jgi:hypothetical protein
MNLNDATGVWANDLVWSWVNSQIARKIAQTDGHDDIHAMCSKVYIGPEYQGRDRPVEEVLASLGHSDLIPLYLEVWKATPKTKTTIPFEWPDSIPETWADYQMGLVRTQGKIVSLFEAGKSIDKIASELRMHVPGIQQFLACRGLVKRGKVENEEFALS